jgi:UDP-GlcNAc:undecaprenyl-phosphate/decaprenyl-phosphate GlcNAc-1-phosphate transferase
MNDILLYTLSAIILTGILLLYFRMARRYSIVDQPNQRSSHKKSTIRGGGIIFPLAVVLWFLFFGFGQPWFIVGLVLMAAISFMDDVMVLSSVIRISVHFAAVTLLFWQAQLFSLPWPYILVAYIFTIGWINAFNFMDGINGITAFYALVALGTFWVMNHSVPFASSELIILLIICVLIFTFFNARKYAVTFAGDVGSISMAFLLAWLMASLMIKTSMVVYMLFFVVYGIDTVITLLYRLEKKENIFRPHRSHLYQLLSNEMKWPQLLVAALYAGIQLVINVGTVLLIENGRMTRGVFIGILGGLAMVYLIVRYWVGRHITLIGKGS